MKIYRVPKSMSAGLSRWVRQRCVESGGDLFPRIPAESWAQRIY